MATHDYSCYMGYRPWNCWRGIHILMNRWKNAGNVFEDVGRVHLFFEQRIPTNVSFKRQKRSLQYQSQWCCPIYNLFHNINDLFNLKPTQHCSAFQKLRKIIKNISMRPRTLTSLWLLATSKMIQTILLTMRLMQTRLSREIASDALQTSIIINIFFYWRFWMTRWRNLFLQKMVGKFQTYPGFLAHVISCFKKGNKIGL